MTTTWKARPTTYRGIQMRSRLEATMADVLDDGGYLWQYEPRAFAAPRRRQYLPDFEVHYPGVASTCYLEVKPTVDLAYIAMSRMTVIWESEPGAWLWVSVPPADVEFLASPKERVFRVVQVPD